MTTLSEQSIRWAIQHLARYRDTDIFPPTFEFDAMVYAEDEIARLIRGQDICQWRIGPLRRCLVPKKRYSFRLATQLDPLDSMFYLSLMREVGEAIEKARLPSARGVCFSYRYLSDDLKYTAFDSAIGYAQFQQRAKDLGNTHEFVVVADIADFYPRIYLHRLENALHQAIRSLPSHVTAVTKLIKGFNQNVSYGIPVGCVPSRLLAEIVIDDVDRVLDADGMVFIRYVDDYRIFCHTRQEAYRCLVRLANILYENHGLTLQSQKTKILNSDEFRQEYLDPEERKELAALAQNFAAILWQLQIDNTYQDIDYSSLPQDIQSQIDGLNLEEMLQEQLNSEEIDIPMTRFLIGKLGHLGRRVDVVRILEQAEKLYPIFADVIGYFGRLVKSFSPQWREYIGASLLEPLRGSAIWQLEYHRMVIMSLFAKSELWGNASRFPRLYDLYPDNWFRPALHLAAGRAGQEHWLRTKKQEMQQLPPWEKRAFLYAVSCFAPDERKAYYRAVRQQANILESTIIDWAESSPINVS